MKTDPLDDLGEPPEGKRVCPNCRALIPTTWVRCMECGKSLRPPVIRFDLEPELPSEPEAAESIPTWLPAPVWDRLFGATLPFVLSLLWVGLSSTLSPSGNAPATSLSLAPFLRLLLPMIAAQTLQQRFPYLAGGFRNALTLVLQLLGTHLILLFVSVVLVIVYFFAGLFHMSGDCLNGGHITTSAPLLTFSPSNGTAVTTLIVQGTMASLLPFQVKIGKRGIQLSREVNSPQGYAALGLIVLIALAWWVPSTTGQGLLGAIATLLSVLLALLKIRHSPELSPKARYALGTLVVVLGLIALGTSTVHDAPEVR